MVFLKANARGKCFIEYLPAENAWVPVEAEGYLYIDCFWASGQLKGKGYAKELIEACIKDAKEQGKRGLVILSSKKKQPFLSDAQFLLHYGFEEADQCDPYFMLYCLRFDKTEKLPAFSDSVRHPKVEKDGWVLYYTDQCPYTAKYVPLLEQVAKKAGNLLQIKHIQSREEARKAPVPFTSFSLFYQGTFVTHEILSEKKFETIMCLKSQGEGVN